MNQFYGIEINDFAVAVAKTALWIAEEQMMDATQEILLTPLHFLPLTSNDSITQANALRFDWNDLLPASECDYIIGNPPFVGAKIMSKEQKQEVVGLFGKVKLASSIDYVAAWYVKAAQMMEANPSIHAAFVSTNSIAQGQQVMPVWSTLIVKHGIHIDFAYRTFIWNNEASEQAHVHVVIIGFSRNDTKAPRKLFDGADVMLADNINPYLAAAPNVIVDVAPRPICSEAKECDYGSLINDGGNYIFKPQELEDFLKLEPNAEKFVRPLVGSDELISGRKRYVLYLRDASDAEIAAMPEVEKRVQAVRALRSKSSAEATRKTANTPTRFYFDSTSDENYLILPSTSSERRRYIPMDFADSRTVVTNAVSLIPGATLYDFGILTSQFHNAWMRAVAGRLEMRYRYSPKTVYNTFIWPDSTPMQRASIENAAQAVFDTRALYPNKSLAQLYDPEKMPSDLLAAHKALDKMVEDAYGVEFNGDEERIVAHLFGLYADVINEER